MGKVASYLVRFGKRGATVIAFIFALMVTIVERISTMIVDVTQWAVDNMVGLSGLNLDLSLDGGGEMLSLANYFFPVAEMWAMLIVGVAFMLFFVILRFIKSWIPTMAN